MLNDAAMVEEKTGQIEVIDITAEVMEDLLFFLYHDYVDKKKIDCHLLKAADKYNIRGLIRFCSEHLSNSLTLDNALDVMVIAYQTDQNDLLDAAFKFVLKNKGKLVKTDTWKEMVKTYPDLIGKAFSQSMLQTTKVEFFLE